jgi:hypothetical protein
VHNFLRGLPCRSVRDSSIRKKGKGSDRNIELDLRMNSILS